jgi:tetrahydromethanopterin S-methyltransferase subunit G
MPIGQKITAYEQILNEQTRLTERLDEIRRKGNVVLEPCGQAFTDYLSKSAVRVPKKREINPVLASFAERIGNSLASILANGSTSEITLEQYLGKDSYAKLKAIADEWSIQGYGSKNFDPKESERVWQEYTKIRTSYQEVKGQLDRINRRMEQANQYVSYVQKLAEVASKTKRLMQ